MSAAKLEVGQGGKCRACGRALRNEASRAAGIGPVCARKEGAVRTIKTSDGSGVEVHFNVVRVTPGYVFLTDESEKHGGRSITNAADEVVREILAQYPGKRIIYRDSGGVRWDELVHDGERFTDYAPAAEIVKEQFA